VCVGVCVCLCVCVCVCVGVAGSALGCVMVWICEEELRVKSDKNCTKSSVSFEWRVGFFAAEELQREREIVCVCVTVCDCVCVCVCCGQADCAHT